MTQHYDNHQLLLLLLQPFTPVYYSLMGPHTSTVVQMPPSSIFPLYRFCQIWVPAWAGGLCVICDTGRCIRLEDSALRLGYSCLLQLTPCWDDEDDDVNDDDDDGKARS